MSMSLSMQCHQNIPYGDRTSFTFSEFGPQESLDRRHMVFGNSFGWVLSISMCVQNFYPNIPYGPRIMGNFHVFTHWTSAKPRPMDNGILQSLGLDLVSINGHAKLFIKLFHKVQEIGPFSLFQNLNLGKSSTDEIWHLKNSRIESINTLSKSSNRSLGKFKILVKVS